MVFCITTDLQDLQAAILETQLLRVTSMSTAVLIVFVDSAKNLPVRLKRDWSLFVYPHYFGFKEKYRNSIAAIPTSEIWTRIKDHYVIGVDSTDDNISVDRFSMSEGVPLSRSSSVRTASQVEGATISTKSKDLLSSSLDNSIVGEELAKSTASSISATPPPRSPNLNTDSVLTHRFPDTTTSAGEHNLGRIQLSIHYSVTRQKLSVTIHKIMHIPLTDPSNIPDPYVKLYLLPGRTKESKRKTNTIKDNCNQVYEATFEYVISSAELMQTDLEVTVCTQKGFLYGGSPVIGMLKIALAEPDISAQGLSSWFDLQPETKHE